VRRTVESIQWGLFCTSSWTWCIGMYMPFILLRLWGWPGFWAFLVPNVLGCAAFGFVLDGQRSRALAAKLGWICALFSAVTVAYQCYFAGWAAGWLAQVHSMGHEASSANDVAANGVAPALWTVAATGAPIALLVGGLFLALRGNPFWRTAGTAVTLLSGLVVLLPGGVDPLLAGPDAVGRGPVVPSLETLPLAFAFPTICAGFVLTPYLDLTFHRAAQEAPNPRIAFATFGLTFAAMLLLVASFYDPSTGLPRIGPALLVLWGVQLLFTVAVHLRELITAPAGIRVPASVVGGLTALAVLLATPAFLFTLGPKAYPGDPPFHAMTELPYLLKGEPIYLTFLGAYGLLFPVLFLLEPAGVSRKVTVGVLLLGLPCYLLGAYDFMTYLMPVPVLLALVARRVLAK
jgi:hypothetical protein